MRVRSKSACGFDRMQPASSRAYAFSRSRRIRARTPAASEQHGARCSRPRRSPAKSDRVGSRSRSRHRSPSPPTRRTSRRITRTSGITRPTTVTSASTFNNGPLHALGDGVDGPSGVYHYGSGSAFPSDTYHSANYWVDVVFGTSCAGDTTPPIVNAVTPAAGADRYEHRRRRHGDFQRDDEPEHAEHVDDPTA